MHTNIYLSVAAGVVITTLLNLLRGLNDTIIKMFECSKQLNYNLLSTYKLVYYTYFHSNIHYQYYAKRLLTCDIFKQVHCVEIII